VRREEPNLIVDTLLVSAIIEARSCERFASLVPVLDPVDPVLAKFYASLLKSEARHYQDYLRLARSAADELLSDPTSIESRLDVLLDCDRELIESADTQLRFHSGVPWSG
jgi:tRNA-(ms[2]io[6]A)-hydroxylase